jgi:hypothetical protein
MASTKKSCLPCTVSILDKSHISETKEENPTFGSHGWILKPLHEWAYITLKLRADPCINFSGKWGQILGFVDIYNPQHSYVGPFLQFAMIRPQNATMKPTERSPVAFWQIQKAEVKVFWVSTNSAKSLKKEIDKGTKNTRGMHTFEFTAGSHFKPLFTQKEGKKWMGIPNRHTRSCQHPSTNSSNK